ncbi:type II toxin-antitoxin system RelE/ParE family toxin [Oscillospiraceae bacterium 44-34]
MYKLEYLPVARRDMIEIVRYISQELQNPTAADQLAMELIEAGDSIPKFPYANPAFIPIRPLKHEYRKLLVQNYFMFYWVDEVKKLVTVARVVYARRDYKRLLE